MAGKFSGPMQVFGIESLDKAFNDLPAGMRKQAVRPAVTKMASMVQKRAKALAPKGPRLKGHRPGALRKSIKSRVRKSKSGKALKTQVSRAVFSDTTTLGLPRFYPAKVELGTQHRPPTSFLRRGLDESGKAAIAVARGIIWSKLKVLAKKHAAKMAAKGAR